MAESTQFTSGSSTEGRSRNPGGSSGGSSGTNSSGGVSGTDIKAVGNELVSAVREKTDSLLSEQKNRAADEIAAVAGMLRSSVESLDTSSRGALAEYAESAAGEINQFADRLRNASWSELGNDTEDLARRWPTLFIAAAVGVGFVAGRFLLASGSRTGDLRGHGTPYYGRSGSGTGVGTTGSRHQATRSIGTGQSAGYGSTGSTVGRETR